MNHSATESAQSVDLSGSDVSGALTKLAVSLRANSAYLMQASSDTGKFTVGSAWSETADRSEMPRKAGEFAIAGSLVGHLLERSGDQASGALLVENPVVDLAAGSIGGWALAAIEPEDRNIVVALVFADQPRLTPEVAVAIESFCDLVGLICRRRRSEIALQRKLEVELVLSAAAERLAEVDVDSVESEIQVALAGLGRQMGCVIATIWDDGEDGMVHRSHVWVDPDIGKEEDYPVDEIPFDHPISARIRSGHGPAVIRFADHVGATHDRVSQALVTAPLFDEGVVAGAVTLAFVASGRIDHGFESWSHTAAGFAGLVTQLRRRAAAELAHQRSRMLESVAAEITRMFVDAKSSDADQVTIRAIRTLGTFLEAKSVCCYDIDPATGDSRLTESWTADPAENIPATVQISCSHTAGTNAKCEKIIGTVDSDGTLTGALICIVGDPMVDRVEIGALVSSVASLLAQFRKRTDAERDLDTRRDSDRVLRDVAAELIGTGADVARALNRLAAGLGVPHVSLWRGAAGGQPGRRTRIDCMARAGTDPGRTHAYLPASVVAAYPAPGDILEYPINVVPKWLESVVGHKLDPAPRRISIAVTQIDDQEVIGLFVVSNGIAPVDDARQQMLVRAVAMLAQHQARLAAEDTFVAAFESAPTAITIRDASGALIACNQAYLAFAGRSRAEVMGTKVESLLVDGGGDVQHPNIGNTVELPYERPDGTIRWARVQFNSVTLAGRPEPVLLSHLEDITESRQSEQLVLHRATHDSLTELPNRDGFFGSLGDESSTAGCAVMVVDLDHFGAINDTLGHHIGDMALITASDRMRLTLRPTDQICRLGGDEFAIHMGGGVTEREVAAVATRLLTMMQEPMRLGGQEVYSTLSIGAVMGSESHSVPELVRFADTAMYHAKKHGRDRYVMFDDELRRELADRLNLESELRVAIRSGQFAVHYQPEVDLSTGRVLGTEALVRWNHPERGLQTAGSFIEVAEDSGLIVELGRWVLAEAAQQASAWRQAGHDLMMRVNLSTRQLRPAVIGEIREALLAAGLRPEHLCLEVTETAIMEDVEESMRLLRQISDLGVKLAIDDFGTGYSSLAYLKRFPVDILKIDKSFVDGVGLNDQDTGIVDTVIRLGRALGLDVVAEGIENSRQLEDLVGLGCRRGQGFYMAKPASPAAITELLELASQI